MAYTFDGNDNIAFGSDASVDDFLLKTIAVWVGQKSIAADGKEGWVDKTSGGLFPTGWHVVGQGDIALGLNHVEVLQDYSVTDGTWDTPDGSIPAWDDVNGFAAGTQAIMVVYDRQGTGDDPEIYKDAVLLVEAETSVPAGASNADAGETLRIGADLNGILGFFVYDDTLMTQADSNRHRWWGVAPGGPSSVSVWHPLWTESLVNKGTATANGTVTGATQNNTKLPRVERCWGGLMGVGR